MYTIPSPWHKTRLLWPSGRRRMNRHPQELFLNNAFVQLLRHPAPFSPVEDRQSPLPAQKGPDSLSLEQNRLFRNRPSLYHHVLGEEKGVDKKIGYVSRFFLDFFLQASYRQGEKSESQVSIIVVRLSCRAAMAGFANKTCPRSVVFAFKKLPVLHLMARVPLRWKKN